jgi:hypothetical protein
MLEGTTSQKVDIIFHRGRPCAAVYNTTDDIDSQEAERGTRAKSPSLPPGACLNVSGSSETLRRARALGSVDWVNNGVGQA